MSVGADRQPGLGGHKPPGKADTDAKLRRSAWLIGLVALAVYVGFIAWNLIRARLGL